MKPLVLIVTHPFVSHKHHSENRSLSWAVLVLKPLGEFLLQLSWGKLPHLSCYTSLGLSGGDAVELHQPVGHLGCEYDMERLRIFFEHQSSPSRGDDSPGFNHAGIKYLFPITPFTGYVGVSVDFGSEFSDFHNPLGIVGIESQGDIRVFVEHVNSITNPGSGHTLSGVKFIF